MNKNIWRNIAHVLQLGLQPFAFIIAIFTWIGEIIGKLIGFIIGLMVALSIPMAITLYVMGYHNPEAINIVQNFAGSAEIFIVGYLMLWLVASFMSTEPSENDEEHRE